MPVTERNGSIAMLNELADIESRINIYQTSLRKSDTSAGLYEETIPVKKRNNTFQSIDSKTDNSADVIEPFPKSKRDSSKRPGITSYFSTTDDRNGDDNNTSKLSIQSIAENSSSSSGTEKKTNELEREIQDLKDLLAESRLLYDREIQELEKELISVKSDVGAFIDRESEYETRIKNVTAEKDALKKDVEHLKAQMHDVRSKMVESKRSFFQHLTGGRHQVERVGGGATMMRRLSLSSVSHVRKRSSSLFNVEFGRRRSSCGGSSGVSSVSSSGKSGDANIEGRRPSLLDLLFYVPFDDRKASNNNHGYSDISVNGGTPRSSSSSGESVMLPSWRRILPLGGGGGRRKMPNQDGDVPNERGGGPLILKSVVNVFKARHPIDPHDENDGGKKNDKETMC